MDIPAHVVSNYDQRVMAVGESLDGMVKEFNLSVKDEGETATALALAYSLAEMIDPMIIIDLLVVSILRLARS